LTINDAIIDKSSNASAENNTVVPQPAELMVNDVSNCTLAISFDNKF